MMIQGYYRTGNLNACMKRLVNQYGVVNQDHDYNDDADNEATNNSYSNRWPHSIGDGFVTQLEQDAEDLDYVFNLQLTQEQADSMPKNDNPNFTFQYEGEREDPQDPESPLLPLPTYKVKQYDIDGVWLGTYYDRDICVQR